jgi:hypothetical protein
MDIIDITDAQRFLEIEFKAENYAIPFVYGVNFSDCLRMNGIDTEIEVDGKKIQAHRIYGLWETFLIGIGETTGQTIITKTPKGKEKEKPVVKQPTRFADVADSLIKKMQTWITTDHTDVYKSLVQENETDWLETVIRFAVYRRIMENKYHKWMTTGKGFADPSVATRIAEVYRFKYEMPNLARLIHEKLLVHKDHHEPEDWEKRLSQDIITGLFDLVRVDRLRLLPPVTPDMSQIEGTDDTV